ncbi:MAG: M23 family metallopeptidase [Polyangiaceae bacterium]
MADTHDLQNRYSRPSVLEMFGLSPLRERARQAAVVFRGAEHVPPAQYDLSSLRMLRPRISLPLWAGRFAIPRKAILSLLFNHKQTDIARGWSVKRTQVEDFRGKGLTYDSHNGTDFSIPVGTRVTAAAPGRVVRVVSEFNRGGLKVAIDHGDGLITSSAHLARAFVKEGDLVKRGETIALSGYSGLDGFTTFPWGVPHVHFNTWLDGTPVDPFARVSSGEASLWRGGMPTPEKEGTDMEGYAPSTFDEDAVTRIVSACKSEKVSRWLENVSSLEGRGNYLVFEMNYYPTRFPVVRNPYGARHERTPRLSLPFRPEDVEGCVFGDEI